MNLTSTELIHATDKQLAAVGITRKQNKGWLRDAIDRTFSEGEVAAFWSADPRRKKENKIDPEDKNVAAVRAKLESRMLTGLKKYGVTTERTDLNRKQWLQHAQEEAMDLAVYLERLIQEES